MINGTVLPSTAAITIANLSSSMATALPPLPAYTLSPIPDLVPFISDYWLALVLPVAVYWVVSLFFYLLDLFDLLPQYRLHPPEEIARRNLASQFQVARDVIVQQVIQIAQAALLAATEPLQLVGKEDFDVAVWATRVRLAQRALPSLLGFLGLDAASIAQNISASHPVIAAVLAGGHYPFLTTPLSGASSEMVPAFATWEMTVAMAIYWLVIPGLKLFLAICLLDTWQYFLHRLMHTNKWMYTNLHSRHHRLYVPYAFGALYNHPVEGFLLDTLGASMAYKLAFMTSREGLLFFCFSTVKTVDDHSGYALPWDPLQHMTANNAAYHDIHHQTWGIKNNFSQPFFTFWDRLLGTKYNGPRSSLSSKTLSLSSAPLTNCADGTINASSGGKETRADAGRGQTHAGEERHQKKLVR